MKQTAVDWLFLMMNNPNKDQEFSNKLFKKAKEMEKEQQGYREEDIKSFADWCRNGLLNSEYSVDRLTEHLKQWKLLKKK